MPDSILTVTTARTDDGRLVALDDLKVELNETGTDKDDYYNAVLIRATTAVEQYCARVFAVETVSEAFRCARWPQAILLGRFPVSLVASVTIDGDALDQDEYEYDAANGMLWRLSDDARVCWSGVKIVVAYSAGYETIPGPVQDGIFTLVKQAQAARSRDPALRSENILEGLYSYTLFNGENMASVLDAVSGLSSYINHRVI